MSGFEQDDIESTEMAPYDIREYELVARSTNIYLSKEIGPPHKYVSLIEQFRCAQRDDTIMFYLNTPGGYLDTGIQIIHAMRDCPARVITVMDGMVGSMGALIFLAGRECIVHDYSKLMFHNYSSGTFGKGHEQIAQINAISQQYSEMLKDIATPFLTEQEIQNIIDGQDMWLSPDEVRERMELVAAYRQLEAAQIEQQHLLLEEEVVLKRIAAREKKAAKKLAKTPPIV
jgi:ATP-dependent Clp protease protease subunit